MNFTVAGQFFGTSGYARHCRALANALVEGVEGDLVGTFNIGSGEDTSINEIVETIQEIIADKLDVTYEPSKAFDVQKMRLDIQKITSAFDWRPTTSFRKGLEEQYLWMQKIVNTTDS